MTPRVMVHPRILTWHKDLEPQKILMKGLDLGGDEWSDMDADEAQEAFWS